MLQANPLCHSFLRHPLDHWSSFLDALFATLTLRDPPVISHHLCCPSGLRSWMVFPIATPHPPVWHSTYNLLQSPTPPHPNCFQMSSSWLILSCGEGAHLHYYYSVQVARKACWTFNHYDCGQWIALSLHAHLKSKHLTNFGITTVADSNYYSFS